MKLKETCNFVKLILVPLCLLLMASCNDEPENNKGSQGGSKDDTEYVDKDTSDTDTGTDSNDKNTDEDINNDETKLTEALIGTWTFENNNMFVFAEDGTGYYQFEDTQQKWKGSITRYWIKKWYVKGNTLYYSYQNFSFEYEKPIYIEKDKMHYNYNTSSEKIYRRLNNNRKYDCKYGSAPFVNYIQVMGAYFPLSQVTLSAKHGYSSNSNMKQIEFSGPNVNYYVRYFTPRNEGINNKWADGSYKINPSGSSPTAFWTYTGTLELNGSFSTTVDDENATLKISRSGSIATYTLKSAEINIYFVGEERSL